MVRGRDAPATAGGTPALRFPGHDSSLLQTGLVLHLVLFAGIFLHIVLLHVILLHFVFFHVVVFHGVFLHAVFLELLAFALFLHLVAFHSVLRGVVLFHCVLGEGGQGSGQDTRQRQTAEHLFHGFSLDGYRFA